MGRQAIGWGRGVVFRAVDIFAPLKLAGSYRKRFPQCLDGAPMLLPSENTTLPRALDQWFELERIRPKVVAEFEDSALLKVFGQAGHGLFPAPAAIAKEVQAQYAVRRVGTLEGVRERFYAISVERKLKHPAVLAITEAARSKIFG